VQHNHDAKQSERRVELTNLWHKARKELLLDHDPDIRHLQNKLGIKLDMTAERWLEGPGRYVGAIHSSEVNRIFTAPPSRSFDEFDWYCEVLPGGGWNKVLVLPVFDLPMRMKGMVIAGRELKEQDVVFRAIRQRRMPVSPKQFIELDDLDSGAGVTMLQSLDHADDVAFVMNDPILALKLQCWHL
jgi:hypothetical protein